MQNNELFDAFIREYKLCSTISHAEMQSILNLTKTRRYNDGEYVYHDGDDAENCFFILSGEVELFKFDDMDHKRIHARLIQGDSFGIPELFEGKYQLNAQCVENTHLARLDRQNFFSNAITLKQFSHDVMKMMAAVISLYQRSISIHKAENRFYSYLYFLAKNSDGVSTKEMQIVKPKRYEDIGNIVGLTRETVTRMINKLKKDNIITITETHFIIKDLKRLKNLAYYDELLSGYYGSGNKN